MPTINQICGELGWLLRYFSYRWEEKGPTHLLRALDALMRVVARMREHFGIGVEKAHGEDAESRAALVVIP